MTITRTVDIPADRRVIIDIPREIPDGQVVLTFTPKAAMDAAQPKKGRKPGCLKGQIWMAEDFDAPLEDFKDYM